MQALQLEGVKRDRSQTRRPKAMRTEDPDRTCYQACQYGSRLTVNKEAQPLAADN